MTWRIATLLALVIAGVFYYAAKHRRPPASSADEVAAIIHRAPILVAGVNEPQEMRAEPVEPPKVSDADKALGKIINTKGKLNPADLPKLVNPIIASYPKYGAARVMRLGGLCEIPTSSGDAIASDIEVVLNDPSAVEMVSKGSLLAMKAKLEHTAGQETEAITDLEAAVRANEQSPSDIFNNGGVKPDEHSSSMCMWTEADLDGLVKSFPADYRVHLFRGLYYAFFAMYDEPSVLKAQENIQQAIEINKSSGPLYFYHANVLIHNHFLKRLGSESVQKAENPAILKDLDQAIELAPNFKPALAARAELYFQTKQYANTIADYDRLLQLDPDNSTALHDQALAKLETGDNYGAISGLSKAIDKMKEKKKEPVSANAYENLGNAYLKTHQNAEAIEAYTKAIGAQIGSGIYLMSLAQFRRIFPEYASATNEAVTRKIQQTYFPQFEYGEFAKNFDDPGKKPFETFLIKDLYLKRADTYLLAGKYRDAFTDYKRAVNSFENYADSVERWHTVQTNPAMNTLIDLKSADFAHDNAMRVWIKQQRGSDENIPYEVEQYEINCVDRQIRMLSSANYNATGDLIGSRQGDNKWNSVIPDTLGETLSTGMCAAP